ncbi:MAG: hypothetical protein EXQ86_06970 [Rhodospirillales bacterium]|nr:hypothetical protein [Rhodospirillales bacterium]
MGRDRRSRGGSGRRRHRGHPRSGAQPRGANRHLPARAFPAAGRRPRTRSRPVPASGTPREKALACIAAANRTPADSRACDAPTIVRRGIFAGGRRRAGERLASEPIYIAESCY